MAPTPQKPSKDSVQILSAISPNQWLLLFCLFQLIFWTLGPFAVRFNPVYDTMESFVWGNQWQWGYDKHPPFTAWMTALFGHLTSNPDFGIYLLAQLSVVITFLGVWRLAREYLNNHGAVLSVLLLTGVLHYSNQVERVTPDTMQSPVWALLALTFYFAVIKRSMVFWVLAGLLAGISILTKYQSVVLLIPMILALLCSNKSISTLKSPGPWVGAAVSLLVLTPHLIWLYDNHFPALQYLDKQYVSELSSEQQSWTMHLTVPLNFALSCLGNILLLLFVIWPLFKASRNNDASTGTKTGTKNNFNHFYLIALALGPTVVSMLFGAINAREMVPRWSTPYYGWLPLLILVWLNRDITSKLFNKMVIRCFILALTLWALRISYLYYKPYISTDYWKADEFAPALDTMKKAESLWGEHYTQPLPYIGGQHYHVMALAAHGSNNTVPFSNLDPNNSLWIKESDFIRQGGIIVLEKNSDWPGDELLMKKYPEALFLGTFKFRPYIPDDIENATHSIVSYYLLPPAAAE